MQVPWFIINHTTIRDEKMWQFYLLIALWSSVFTTMSISVLLFLQHLLWGLFLAGLAIAVWNTVSFFLDWLFSSLQKRFTSRVLFMTWIIWMIISVLLFIIFSNIFFVFLATIFFSISFDMVDITALSYIMAESLPANYWQNLSYKDLFQWVWMILWMIISAIILSSAYFIWWSLEYWAEVLKLKSETFEASIFATQIILLFILFWLFFFAFIIFDKNVKVLSKEYIKTSFQVLKSATIEWLKNNAIEVKKKAMWKFSTKNQIELKSTNEKEKLNRSEIFWEINSWIQTIKKIFTYKPKNTSLIRLVCTLTLFSYWDTFLWTFFPIFFTEFLKAQSWFLKDIPGSLMTLLFILPVLWLYPVFAKLWDKHWRFLFIYIWLWLTAFAVFFMGITPYSNFWLFIVFWFMVWIWYVSAMSSVKAETATKINEFSAVINWKWKIDSNTSAWPMMMTNNVWNIVWPLFWWLFIDLLWFQWFFTFFWILLLIFFAYSLYIKKEVEKPPYIFEW